MIEDTWSHLEPNRVGTQHRLVPGFTDHNDYDCDCECDHDYDYSNTNTKTLDYECATLPRNSNSDTKSALAHASFLGPKPQRVQADASLDERVLDSCVGTGPVSSPLRLRHGGFTR